MRNLLFLLDSGRCALSSIGSWWSLKPWVYWLIIAVLLWSILILLVAIIRVLDSPRTVTNSRFCNRSRIHILKRLLLDVLLEHVPLRLLALLNDLILQIAFQIKPDSWLFFVLVLLNYVRFVIAILVAVFVLFLSKLAYCLLRFSQLIICLNKFCCQLGLFLLH